MTYDTEEERKIREAYKKFIYDSFKPEFYHNVHQKDFSTCPLCKGSGKVPKSDTKDDVKAYETE